MVSRSAHQAKGTGTVIAVQDGLVWFRTGEGRLKFPDVIRKVERL